MMHHWFKKPKTIVFAALLLTLALAIACGASAPAAPAPSTATPVANKAPAATAVPAAGSSLAPAPVVTSTTKRLVVALGPLSEESNAPWLASPVFDREQLYERLIGIERSTGELIPQLATKWEMSPDGLDLTFWLRKGVPFHYGWGEFTARDVKHMVAMLTQQGSVASESDLYRETTKEVEIINDYQVIFHQQKPNIFSVPYYNSQDGSSVIMSKAQWDAEGLEGYQRRPVGTGAYRYVSRVPSQSLLAERAVGHWRKTPEFEELQRLFTKEEATRLAALLAGEAHLVVLPKDLEQAAKSKGYKVLKSVVPGGQTQWFFGGQYYATPEHLQPFPWIGQTREARLVRQAMNKAINRQEIITNVYHGDAEPARVSGFHRTLPGFNPEWDQKWEELYGYDPKRAKELLAEAGYPNGFKMTVLLTPTPSVPEASQIGQILGQYFQAIGLDATLEQMDNATLAKKRRAYQMQGKVYATSANYRDPQTTIQKHNSSVEGLSHYYEDNFIDEKYEALTRAIDPMERDRIERELGDHKFNEFAEIPFLWFAATVAVNSDVVAEYIYPGNHRAYYSHLEYIKAAKQK